LLFSVKLKMFLVRIPCLFTLFVVPLQPQTKDNGEK
jgi:hypothetical protein